MQCATIEFARNVCNLKDAHSSEFNAQTKNPVIHLMPEQEKIANKGGTMRLGAYPCVLEKDSSAYRAYQQGNISERHRHRYEFNNDYREKLTQAGLLLSGLSPDKKLVEIIELPKHPWFVAVQFHPELKSRPTKAHPLFREFVGAAVRYKKVINKETFEKI
jgi:CTP synthase